MHEAGLIQLPHRRVHDGETGLSAPPSFQTRFLRRRPGQAQVILVEFLFQHFRMKVQDSEVELAPGQFRLKGVDALARLGGGPNGRFFATGVQLPDTDQPPAQVLAQPRRALRRRKIPPLFILRERPLQKGLHPRAGRFLAGRQVTLEIAGPLQFPVRRGGEFQ